MYEISNQYVSKMFHTRKFRIDNEIFSIVIYFSKKVIFLDFFSRDVTSNQKFSALNPKIPVGMAYFVWYKILEIKK